MLKPKLQSFGHLMGKANSMEKTLMLGRIPDSGEGDDRDEMVGWHHWLNGYEFEQAPGGSKGQGSLVCRRWWGSKELDTTEWPNNNSEGGGRQGTTFWRRFSKRWQRLENPCGVGSSRELGDLGEVDGQGCWGGGLGNTEWGSGLWQEGVRRAWLQVSMLVWW